MDLLARTNMINAKPILTPLPTSPPITLQSGTTLSEPIEYRTIVRSLQYLLITRLDLAFTVNKLSQFMHWPTTNHWVLVKRLLCYLCGSFNDCIQFYRDHPLSVHAYSDVDCAGNKDDFSSTSVMLKQRTVARSFTVAEYRAVASTAAELN
ncbi:hypothetical protein Pint_31516 [Pistacia integerrima]|uniref:Uncharacterized protein n=1 Tax=Pistacia integerrima TaxID=434235 RepID=A0ACC0XP31_9ROSI|nr:hypothetical protein Pint_31516 [Pistacia integerrima]